MEEENKDQVIEQVKEKKEIKLEYIPFVIISSIIGLVLAFLFFYKVLSLSNVLSIIFSILCVSVYISICLSLKKYLEKWILSEIFLYLFFGFLTTAVNIIAFNVLTVTFKGSITDASIAWKAAEGIAFVIAVLFAYITNKLFVFKSVSFDLSILGREVVGFFGARIMCCLKYEEDVYEEKLKRLPKIGAIVKTEDGEGIVEGVETLKERLRIKLKD